MPIGSIKTLADLLIALVSERRRHREAIFENHIKPCYEAAKVVFDDYMQYYNKLEEYLDSDKTLEDILKYIRARRLEKLSNREELRAILDNKAYPPLDPFDSAILVLISGSQAVNHEFGHYTEEIVNYLKFKKNIMYPEEDFRTSLLVKALRQQDVITQQFRNVAHEYAQSRNTMAERSRKQT